MGDLSTNNMRSMMSTTKLAATPEVEGRRATRHMAPEPQEGNIEYKLKLIDPDMNRMERLMTQMKWRLEEGHGTAVYQIGVMDNGAILGLNQGDMDASLKTLSRLAEEIGATVSNIEMKDIGKGKKIAAVNIAMSLSNTHFVDVRIAMAGSAEAGKSTLLSVLAHGENDNGYGKARLNLLRHSHEIRSGRTSSISRETLGFDEGGNFLRSSCVEIYQPTKVVSFADFPGHERYLKTAAFGFIGKCIDFCALVVSGTAGISGTAKEHYALATALGVPIIIVVTKIDLCTRPVLKNTLDTLKDLLAEQSSAKRPMLVMKDSDLADAAASVNTQSEEVPIFLVSSVKLTNVNLLRTFFNFISPRQLVTAADLVAEPLFRVEETFKVQDVGCVVAGVLVQGKVACGDHLVIGPVKGKFRVVTVVSLHRNRVSYQSVQAGQNASMALAGVERDELRPGNVLCTKARAVCSRRIEADLKLDDGQTAIEECGGTLYVGSSRQFAKMVTTPGTDVATGTQHVRFEFSSQPEFVQDGDRIVFRTASKILVGTVSGFERYQPE